jgi:cyclase
MFPQSWQHPPCGIRQTNTSLDKLESVSTSKFFKLEQIANRVWAVISSDPTWMMSNAGIVDLGGQTLVWDTGTSPRASIELKRVAEELTGRTVGIVVNSHYHLDHSLGNQVFAGSSIFSTRITRDLMRARFEQLIEEVKEFPNWIAHTKTQLETVTDAFERRALEFDLAEMEMLSEFMPNFKPTLPMMTFEGSLGFYGTGFNGIGRTARALSFGAGHTVSDTVLHLPEDGILFAGDLVLVDNIPWLGHGDPEAWQVRLTDLEKLEPVQKIVPGHGPVSDRDAISKMHETLLKMVALADVPDANALKSVQVPEAWHEWGLPSGFRGNLQFLFNRCAK